MVISVSISSARIVRLCLALALSVGATRGQVASAQISSNPTRYTLTDLGVLSGGFSQASYISNFGAIVGNASVLNGTAPQVSHATAWYRGQIVDLAVKQPAGLNSMAFGMNSFGLVSGEADIADTSTANPENENFCGFFSGDRCRAFSWQNGVLTPLPTLGGNNAASNGGINDRGEIAGFSETSTSPDPDCPNAELPNGTGPQMFDYEGVIWGPRDMRPLRPLPGDTVSMALWLNQNGEAVGISGNCGDTSLPGFAVGPHAVLWDASGTPHNLPTFGGSPNLSLLGVGNGAYVVNDRGQVAGVSAFPGSPDANGELTPSSSYHAFFWDKESGLKDIGTLQGDVYSSGLGMNNEGTVVGGSLDSQNNPTAYIWRNGTIRNLNCLVPANTPFSFLLVAFSVNDAGQIVGFGVTADGLHAFVAMPSQSDEGPTLCSTTGNISSGAPEDARMPKLILTPQLRRQLNQQIPLRGIPFLDQSRNDSPSARP